MQRNRIKRQLRASAEQHLFQAIIDTKKSYNFMAIYTGKSIPNWDEIGEKFQNIAKKNKTEKFMIRSSIKNIGFTVIVVVITVVLTGFRYDFFEIAKQIEIYNTLFKEINMSYVDKTDPAELMEDGVKHMLSELDPYTVYSSEQDVEDAKIYQSGVYVGIGAKMKVIDKKLFVEEPFKVFLQIMLN